MLESTNALIAATLAFVGGHFLLSSRPLRPWLNERFGERAYRLIYSVAMTVALLWLIAASGAAPRVPVWHHAPVLARVPPPVLPSAALRRGAGLTRPHPHPAGAQRP